MFQFDRLEDRYELLEHIYSDAPRGKLRKISLFSIFAAY